MCPNLSFMYVNWGGEGVLWCLSCGLLFCLWAWVSLVAVPYCMYCCLYQTLLLALFFLLCVLEWSDCGIGSLLVNYVSTLS